jgi:hypothetical protein
MKGERQRQSIINEVGDRSTDGGKKREKRKGKERSDSELTVMLVDLKKKLKVWDSIKNGKG